MGRPEKLFENIVKIVVPQSSLFFYKEFSKAISQIC
jgi:hypothetical protein